MRFLTVTIAVLLLFVADLKAQENVVKLGIPALVAGRFNLNYERVLDANKSVQLTFGVQIPRKTPNLFNTSDTLTSDFDVIKGNYNAMGAAAQMRFYVKDVQEAPGGFYLAPYLAYNRNAFKFDVVQNETTGDNNIDFDATHQSFGFGLVFGTQWLINEKVSIDWNWFGIGLARNNFKFKYSSDDPDVNYEEIKADVDEEFGDAPFIGNKLKTEVNDDSVTAKFGTFWPAFRMSLSVGYAF